MSAEQCNEEAIIVSRIQGLPKIFSIIVWYLKRSFRYRIWTGERKDRICSHSICAGFLTHGRYLFLDYPSGPKSLVRHGSLKTFCTRLRGTGVRPARDSRIIVTVSLFCLLLPSISLPNSKPAISASCECDAKLLSLVKSRQNVYMLAAPACPVSITY